MSNIFISYERESKPLMLGLANDIKRLGHTVWYDQHLSGGQTWWDEILKEIRNCDVFVFALTSRALDSVACKREYEYANELGKPIIPVLIAEGVSTNLLPEALSKIHFVDYRNRGKNAAFDVIKALNAASHPNPLPDPLPTPPAVPTSYLARLATHIEAPNLSHEEQILLVADLKASLHDPSTAKEDARILLDKLRQRSDLLARTEREIDELLGTMRTAESQPGSDATLEFARLSEDREDTPLWSTVIRPYGIKEGAFGRVDFDRVESELILPALSALRISYATTNNSQRNIREKAFNELVTADLVIADVSTHAPNVLYELGIRHAVHKKRTILIKSLGDEIPFDLKTESYVPYSSDEPADALDDLCNAIRKSLDSEATDSPVFRLVPKLQPQDRSRFLVIPADFEQDVSNAEQEGYYGDLLLLEQELRNLGFRWARKGLRIVHEAQIRLRNAQEKANEIDQVLIFMGHGIDSEDRTQPRFPPVAEEEARKMIVQAVQEAVEVSDRTLGIAGGGSGGDILFHEVCSDLGIATHLYLAAPRQDYIRSSVLDAGPAWVRRFNQLHESLPTRTLGPSLKLPRWLRSSMSWPHYSIWERNVDWMLNNAIKHGPSKVVLVTLWDRKIGDGPGGTEYMFAKAQRLGVPAIILNTKKLLSMSESEKNLDKKQRS